MATNLRSGSLLISQPFLGDPNFERSVVLLCRHDEEDGTFGLMLNRPTTVRLGDAMSLPGGDEHPAATLPLHVGGPVQPDTLHYLHQRPDLPGAEPLAEDVYWGGDFEMLLGLIAAGELTENNLRLYVGYSGWTAGQLAGEVQEKTWIVHPNAAGKVFTLTTDAFWQAILREKGGRYRVLSNYPLDPRLN
ncbi:YqgE/AlgH family protein [Hymenobacter jeollabukensis]|uniref:YqgE/AlgH family protein n=1 Tax=Hymenobacter jeollabukensis TaxID=2025313 RepID=A0A5R8WPN0_9BACT|nr:YqgE/AlgH family protein [Hymenobacter jeollabukensis]TLM91692.1 YqgE/AlgH family protein [Hymenobacter jeollabukensis]